MLHSFFYLSLMITLVVHHVCMLITLSAPMFFFFTQPPKFWSRYADLLVTYFPSRSGFHVTGCGNGIIYSKISSVNNLVPMCSCIWCILSDVWCNICSILSQSVHVVMHLTWCTPLLPLPLPDEWIPCLNIPTFYWSTTLHVPVTQHKSIMAWLIFECELTFFKLTNYEVLDYVHVYIFESITNCTWHTLI